MYKETPFRVHIIDDVYTKTPNRIHIADNLYMKSPFHVHETSIVCPKTPLHGQWKANCFRMALPATASQFASHFSSCTVVSLTPLAFAHHRLNFPLLAEGSIVGAENQHRQYKHPTAMFHAVHHQSLRFSRGSSRLLQLKTNIAAHFSAVSL